MNFVVAIILFAIITLNTGIVKPVINQIEEDYPAYKAGIRKDDRIVAVNNNKIKTWFDFEFILAQNQGSEMNITVKRNQDMHTFNVKPVFDKERQKYRIGITPKLDKANFFEAIGEGFNKTIFQ